MEKDMSLWKKSYLYPEARDDIVKNIILNKNIKTGISYANKYPDYMDSIFNLIKESANAGDVVKWIKVIGVKYYSDELLSMFLIKLKNSNNRKNNITILITFIEVLYNYELYNEVSDEDKLIISEMLYTIINDVIMNTNNAALLVKCLSILGSTEYINNKKFINYLINFYNTKAANLYMKFTIDLIETVLKNNNCEYAIAFKINFIMDNKVNYFVSIVNNYFYKIYPNYSSDDFYNNLPREYRLNVIL